MNDEYGWMDGCNNLFFIWFYFFFNWIWIMLYIMQSITTNEKKNRIMIGDRWYPENIVKLLNFQTANSVHFGWFFIFHSFKIKIESWIDFHIFFPGNCVYRYKIFISLFCLFMLCFLLVIEGLRLEIGWWWC